MKCFLYTLDGIKEAEVLASDNNISTIQTIGGRFKIRVNNNIINHKFEQETKPTFYAC